MVRAVFACAKTRGALVWGISPQASVVMVLVRAYMVAHPPVPIVAQDLPHIRAQASKEKKSNCPLRRWWNYLPFWDGKHTLLAGVPGYLFRVCVCVD